MRSGHRRKCDHVAEHKSQNMARILVQAWFALDAPRFRALLPAPWADLALVSGSVHLF